MATAEEEPPITIIMTAAARQTKKSEAREALDTQGGERGCAREYVRQGRKEEAGGRTSPPARAPQSRCPLPAARRGRCPPSPPPDWRRREPRRSPPRAESEPQSWLPPPRALPSRLPAALPPSRRAAQLLLRLPNAAGRNLIRNNMRCGTRRPAVFLACRERQRNAHDVACCSSGAGHVSFLHSLVASSFGLRAGERITT